jgi:hypothetical protein
MERQNLQGRVGIGGTFSTEMLMAQSALSYRRSALLLPLRLPGRDLLFGPARAEFGVFRRRLCGKKCRVVDHADLRLRFDDLRAFLGGGRRVVIFLLALPKIAFDPS